jgi:hypothetical protein
LATSSARLCEPKKPANAVKKMRNGNSEVSADCAIWLVIAQRSWALNRQYASRKSLTILRINRLCKPATNYAVPA